MKFALLATGGTIASKKSENGIKPEASGLTLHRLVELCPDLMGFEHEINIFNIMSKDSSDMRPDDWLAIASAVRENYNHHDAIIILHGTDTMTWTAAALSYLLNDVNIPVVMTGSMLSPYEINSDVSENIFNAVQFAMQLAMYKRKGVSIAFAGKLIHGLRANKADSRHKNAFISVDYPILGEMRDKGTHKVPWLNAKIPEFSSERPWNDNINLENTARPALRTLNNFKIALLPVFPGMDEDLINKLVESKPCGGELETHCVENNIIVLESYGLGGVPEYLIPAIKNGIDNGVKFVIRSQSLFGGVDLGVYEVGHRLIDVGVIPALNITREALITKLMLLSASGADLKEFINKNICDDVVL